MSGYISPESQAATAQINARLASDRAALRQQQEDRRAEREVSDGELSLELDNVTISGWTGIRVTRGIERCPSDFEISLTEKYPGAATDVVVEPGQVCRVRLGSDLVLTGYVDRYAVLLGPNNHSVAIQGRSAVADVVDCSAQWRNAVINGTNIVDAAQKLCGPYGVAVKALAGAGPTIPQITINLGESPFQVIERIARYAAMLVFDDVTGALVLDTVGHQRMASGVRQAVNVLEASVQLAYDQRYTQYHAFRMSTDSYRDIGDTNSADGNTLDVVVDAGMIRLRRPDGQPRIRHLAVISEQLDQQGQYAIRRAKWEMARRYGRSQVVRVEVDSWRDSAGKLWEPNYRLPVALPACKLPETEMVIGEVSYIRDDRGTRADLMLMPPEAFEPEPGILNPFAAQLQFAPPGDGRRDRG